MQVAVSHSQHCRTWSLDPNLDPAMTSSDLARRTGPVPAFHRKNLQQQKKTSRDSVITSLPTDSVGILVLTGKNAVIEDVNRNEWSKFGGCEESRVIVCSEIVLEPQNGRIGWATAASWREAGEGVREAGKWGKMGRRVRES